MAIKVLLLGLNYIYEKKGIRLYGSINGVVYFYQRLLRLGYKSSEMSVIVDQVNDVSLTSLTSSPSETRVEEIVNTEQVIDILEIMVQESKKDDQLIFFFCGHSTKDLSNNVLIDLGDDLRGKLRGYIHGVDLDCISEKLPKFVTFVPILDCCDSGGIIARVPRQYPTPRSTAENIYRCIVLTAVDSDDGPTHDDWNQELNVMIPDYTYCLGEVLDKVAAKGNDMVTYFNLVERTDVGLKRMEKLRLKRGEKPTPEQRPGLQCSLSESREKFLNL